MRLRVSDNHRYLVWDDGSPFFYLGDTAWALFQRLTREQADHYLADRAAKGFAVIQAVALSEFDGLRDPNPYGDLPLDGSDPTRPSDAYFRHVGYVVDKAASLGLVVGLLPTWGDKVGPVKWGVGPETSTPENARVYGEYLGERYRSRPIIWILGGDRTAELERHKAVWRAMAEGLRRGDGGEHLITYHPMGVYSSSSFFHDEPWLDFNMLESSHEIRDRDNYNLVWKDYDLVPVKPCLDGEPNYEDVHPSFRPEHGLFDAYDARKAAYWAVFAGAHGHTYGANGVFQFWDGKSPDRFHAPKPWHEAIQLPGAAQMGHLRRLVESRPFLARVPDPGLLLSAPGLGADHTRATRAADGGYAFVYSGSGKPFTVDLGRLSGGSIAATWFDPRTGEASAEGRISGGRAHDFHPPSSGRGNDWVLVLDDESRGFGVPGAAATV